MQRELTGPVLVPVLGLGQLRQRDLGVVAENGEEVWRGEWRRLHRVERRQAAQPPARLRLGATREPTTHSLHHDTSPVMSTEQPLINNGGIRTFNTSNKEEKTQ